MSTLIIQFEIHHPGGELRWPGYRNDAPVHKTTDATHNAPYLPTHSTPETCTPVCMSLAQVAQIQFGFEPPRRQSLLLLEPVCATCKLRAEYQTVKTLRRGGVVAVPYLECGGLFVDLLRLRPIAAQLTVSRPRRGIPSGQAGLAARASWPLQAVGPVGPSWRAARRPGLGPSTPVRPTRQVKVVPAGPRPVPAPIPPWTRCGGPPSLSRTPSSREGRSSSTLRATFWQHTKVPGVNGNTAGRREPGQAPTTTWAE